jgi:hypothetical protein
MTQWYDRDGGSSSGKNGPERVLSKRPCTAAFHARKPIDWQDPGCITGMRRRRGRAGTGTHRFVSAELQAGPDASRDWKRSTCLSRHADMHPGLRQGEQGYACESGQGAHRRTGPDTPPTSDVVARRHSSDRHQRDANRSAGGTRRYWSVSRSGASCGLRVDDQLTGSVRQMSRPAL